MSPITKYLEKTGTSQAAFAASIGVTGAAIYQYVHGIRPVSEKLCVRIERATGGAVTRQDLRPKDWQDIWPELKEASHA